MHSAWSLRCPSLDVTAAAKAEGRASVTSEASSHSGRNHQLLDWEEAPFAGRWAHTFQKTGHPQFQLAGSSC